MTALYICYQSLLEPLTQTQVLPYLEGLARAGYRMVLLTWEPRRLTKSETQTWKERIALRGIDWYWTRYHKWPTVAATAWDIFTGIAMGWYLVKAHEVRLIHARSHVPAVMAMVLKGLSGTRFLFDVRGFMAEEYVDAGVWKADGILFRITKRVERKLLALADGLVVLTEKARDILHQSYSREVAGKPIAVIPCCVESRREVARDEWALGGRGTSGRNEELTLVYVGKLGGWYLTETMVAFVAQARGMVQKLRWRVWTQSDPAPLARLIEAYGLGGNVEISSVAPEVLPAMIAGADAGLSFIKPCGSKAASSPSKIGEYLAAGLPVVSTAGIGDVDELLVPGGLTTYQAPEGEEAGRRQAVGVILRDFTSAAYERAMDELLRLLEVPDIRERCRVVASRDLDLERVGWARYLAIYGRVLGKGSEESHGAESPMIAK